MTGRGAPGAMEDEGPLRYAVIGDTHIDPDSIVESDALSRVFAWLEALDPAPDFVVHVGDIVECGFEEQFAAYEALIPASLRERMVHLPGNHETRWDEHANRKFLDRFPKAPFSFDAGGVHFVALDPTTNLQELGQFGHEQLDWLGNDLEAAGTGTPAVLFFHFPVGGRNYFITDQDALFETIAPFNVVAIHAGHIHQEDLLSVNGVTQVTGRSLKQGPFLHLVDVNDGSLVVTSVDLAGAEPLSTPMATIPFERPEMAGIGHGDIRVRSDGLGMATVTVPESLVPGTRSVRARPWPNHVYGKPDVDDAGWVDLIADDSGRPMQWTGELRSAQIVPGLDRLEVQADDAQGVLRQWSATFDVPAPDGPRLLWEHDVGAGAVQAGLVTDGETVVVATSGGDVAGFRVSPRGAEERWRVRDDDEGASILGTPVHDGRGTVFVASRSGRVRALRVGDGSLVWESGFDAPVIASLGLAGAGEDALLLVPCEGRIHALDAASGGERWIAEGGGFLGGRPAADVRAVYASFGDGTLRAFARQDGRELWSRLIVERERRYARLLYSAWAHRTMLLPGMVLTSTVEMATARDRETGDVVWSLPGGFMYAGGTLVQGGTALVLASETGRVVKVDPLTGEVHWETGVGFRSLNAAPVIAGETVYVPGAGAQLAMLDIHTGQVQPRLQLGGTALVSTPVVVDELLVAGGQDGKIRAVRI